MNKIIEQKNAVVQLKREKSNFIRGLIAAIFSTALAGTLTYADISIAYHIIKEFMSMRVITESTFLNITTFLLSSFAGLATATIGAPFVVASYESAIDFIGETVTNYEILQEAKQKVKELSINR